MPRPHEFGKTLRYRPSAGGASVLAWSFRIFISATSNLVACTGFVTRRQVRKFRVEFPKEPKSGAADSVASRFRSTGSDSFFQSS